MAATIALSIAMLLGFDEDPVGGKAALEAAEFGFETFEIAAGVMSG